MGRLGGAPLTRTHRKSIFFGYPKSPNAEASDRTARRTGTLEQQNRPYYSAVDKSPRVIFSPSELDREFADERNCSASPTETYENRTLEIAA